MTQTEHILSLLTATVFADKRVFSEEINVFLKGAARLDILRYNKTKMSETKLLLWYETNKASVKEKMVTPYFKDWFYDLLEKLSDVEDKDAILSVMEDISQADGELHVSERALSALAARYWDVT